ncbi:MAG: translational GTPase TypA, partial [Bacteroidota bacterium]
MIIREIPEPQIEEGPSQLLITSLDYSPYVGRIAVGKVKRGSLKPGQKIALLKRDGRAIKGNVKEVYVFEGLQKKKVDIVSSGDI